jgi:hypothetical protein
VQYEKWRLIAVPERSEKNEGKVLDDFCMTDVDDLTYGGLPVEEFTIIKEGKEASTLVISGLRTKLHKVDDARSVEDAHPRKDFSDSNRRPGYVDEVQLPLMSGY